MPNFDDELRDALEAWAPTSSSANRGALVDVLVARIEDGGADVADAPAPLPVLMPVASGRKRVGRIAGIGLFGWAAVAVGSAAAATGAWLLLDERQPAPETPAITVESPAPTPSEPQATIPPITTNAPSITDAASKPPSEATDPDPEPTIDVALPAPSDVEGELGDKATDAVKDTVKDTVTVVKDVLAPVFGALHVEKPDGLLSGLAQCGTSVPLSVSVADDVGVTAVTASVELPSGTSAPVPLRKMGDTWEGGLATAKLAALLSPGQAVTVTVQARDAAGNTSTTTTSVKASLLACG